MKTRLLPPSGSWFVLICAAFACSSPEGPDRIAPGPPGPAASSAGSGGGGTGGALTHAGSGGADAGSGGGGDGTCKTADCPVGGFCRMGMCTCSAEKPEVCSGPNVGGGPNGVCTSKLTDADNCGQCGMKCAAGAACVAGVCGAPPTDVATATGCGSIRLAVQGGNLYWTEKATGKVMTVPVGGGAPQEVAAGQLSPTQIAADAGGVYWVNQGDDSVGSSKVMKRELPLSAGAPITLKASPGSAKILTITVNGGKLYYGLEHDVHAVSTDESESADAIVGTAINFDQNPPNGVPSGEPAGLAVSGNKVFWSTATRQGVEADDTAPGITGYVELAESQGSLLHQDIGSDGQYGYWVDGATFRRAVAKPPVDIASTPDFDMITAFAMNASDVYFGDEKGLLLKHGLMPPAAGETPAAATALARDQVMTSSIVLDSLHAYWASNCVIRSTGL